MKIRLAQGAVRCALGIVALAFSFGAGAADAPPVEMIPVDAAPPTKDVPPRAASFSKSWATIGTGGLASGHNFGALYWGGLSHFEDRFYVAARGYHAYVNHDPNRDDAPSGCCSDNVYDASLIAGIPLSTHQYIWLGTGISRLQRTKGDERYDKNFVSASWPVELLFTVPTSHVGFEAHLTSEVNGKSNFVSLLLGVRFGG